MKTRNKEFAIELKSVNQVFDILDKLKDKNLYANKDFEFVYCAPKYYFDDQNKCMKIKFYNPEYQIWFMLSHIK